MRNRIITLMLLTLLAVFSGCGRMGLIKAENEVMVEGLFSVWGVWVKDKGRKFDVKLRIANDARHPIMIRRRDLHCSMGDRWGNFRLLNVPRRITRLWISPEQVVTLVGVCEIGERVRGDFRVLIGRVFEGQRFRRHGRLVVRPGDLLATDIEWTAYGDLMR